MNLVGVCILVVLLVVQKTKGGGYDFELSAQAPSMMILSTVPQSRVSRYDVTMEALDQIEKVRAEVLAQLPQTVWTQSTQPCSAISIPFYKPYFSTAPSPTRNFKTMNFFKSSYDHNEATEPMPSSSTNFYKPPYDRNEITQTLPSASMDYFKPSYDRNDITQTMPSSSLDYFKPSYDRNEATESVPSPPPTDNQIERVDDPYAPDFSGWGPALESDKLIIARPTIGPPSIQPPDDFDSATFESGDRTSTQAEVQRDVMEDQTSEFLSNSVTITKPVSLLSAKTGLSPLSPAAESSAPLAPSTLAPPPATTPHANKVFLEIDCSFEKNEHPNERCKNWAQAGYCERHPATKYLFCRLQCLCRRITAVV